jgi:hypothetical protein
MIPPIEIIVRWRPLRDLLSSFLPGVAAVGFVCIVAGTFTICAMYSPGVR